MQTRAEEHFAAAWRERPEPNRLTAQERYERDTMFRALVDAMAALIERCELTPTELREAAILACIRYEHTHCRALYLLGKDDPPLDFSGVAAHCLRCGHYWTIPRGAARPEACPRCKAPWEDPRPPVPTG